MPYKYDPAVAAQQAELNKKGANLKVDGLLGPLTQAAVTKYGAPAATSLPPLNTSQPSGNDQATTLPTDVTQSHLGSFRIALKQALEESAASTAKNRMTQLSGLTEGGAAPSVITAAIGLAQSGLRQSQESVFGDIMTGYKDASEARQKEIDRINDLRLEFGSAVPNSVTDLKTALDFVSPLVDKERKLKLDKMRQEQQNDEDVESAAEFVAKGGLLSQVGGSSDYKAKVRIRAEVLKKTLEAEAEQLYKDKIAFKIEKKVSDYETERASAISDDNLSPNEIRGILDYIDTLEVKEKETKTKSKKTKQTNFGAPGAFSGFVGH